MKAKLFAVPLTKDGKHDVKAMAAASPTAGAYYIVNPNNPTGTMTPKEDIVWLLKNKAPGSLVIVDEAYFHFSNDDSMIDQVAKDQDLIVMRTFSKIYGMAGLRAGFFIGKPELQDKLRDIGWPQRIRFGLDGDGSCLYRRHPGQGADPGPPQDQRRHPLDDAGVDGKERLQVLSRLAGELLHGRCEASWPRVLGPDAEAGRLHRPHLAGDADLRSRHRRDRR
jgi:hypothetical protein